MDEDYIKLIHGKALYSIVYRTKKTNEKKEEESSPYEDPISYKKDKILALEEDYQKYTVDFLLKYTPKPGEPEKL